MAKKPAAKSSFYESLCLLGTWVTTLLYGRRVGQDALGNVYYEARGRAATGQRQRRWVVYAPRADGAREASLVPPEWHGWLHYTQAAPLPAQSKFHQPWQAPHMPNQTGTAAAYRPPGAQLAGGTRHKATGDYQAWQPQD